MIKVNKWKPEFDPQEGHDAMLKPREKMARTDTRGKLKVETAQEKMNQYRRKD